MTRKTKIVHVPELPACDNRDLGKTFLITEWPAARADNWMQRLAYAFNKNGGQIPMNVTSIGWEGIAIIGINTFLRGNVDPAIMISIADELLECVKLIPDPAHPESARPATAEDDIEEVATRWWLRDQVVSVLTNFSFIDALSSVVSSIMAKVPTTDSPNTSTFPPE